MPDKQSVMETLSIIPTNNFQYIVQTSCKRPPKKERFSGRLREVVS